MAEVLKFNRDQFFPPIQSIWTAERSPSQSSRTLPRGRRCFSTSPDSDYDERRHRIKFHQALRHPRRISARPDNALAINVPASSFSPQRLGHPVQSRILDSSRRDQYPLDCLRAFVSEANLHCPSRRPGGPVETLYQVWIKSRQSDLRSSRKAPIAVHSFFPP